ncbi:ferritin [Candidatus Omnitrophota bacterium]
MLSEKMLSSLTRQINRELYSAYFYLGMAMYADSIGYKGFGHWFKVQVEEEYEHAEKMSDYITQQGSRVMIRAIEEPPQDFSSIEDLYKRTFEHERLVTKLIDDLVAVAKDDGDKGTEDFLQWFVKEQIEEMETPEKILGKIREIGKDEAGLRKIDEELTQRK